MRGKLSNQESVRHAIFENGPCGRSMFVRITSIPWYPLTVDQERIAIAFKANATRKMREAGTWQIGRSPWVRRESKKYLWTEKELMDAIAYVLYDQGEPLP